LASATKKREKKDQGAKGGQRKTFPEEKKGPALTGKKKKRSEKRKVTTKARHRAEFSKRGKALSIDLKKAAPRGGFSMCRRKKKISLGASLSRGEDQTCPCGRIETKSNTYILTKRERKGGRTNYGGNGAFRKKGASRLAKGNEFLSLGEKLPVEKKEVTPPRKKEITAEKRLDSSAGKGARLSKIQTGRKKKKSLIFQEGRGRRRLEGVKQKNIIGVGIGRARKLV